MSHAVWRIAADAPTFEADDLSGAGATATGGRWNPAGVPIVYTSQSRALACLETVVHLGTERLPFNRHLVEVTIPSPVWAKARTETASTLPVGWDAEPPGRASIRFGTDWMRAGEPALLIVPSVIVPEEFNILINPLHKESALIAAIKVRRWQYDPRLTRFPE